MLSSASQGRLSNVEVVIQTDVVHESEEFTLEFPSGHHPENEVDYSYAEIDHQNYAYETEVMELQFDVGPSDQYEVITEENEIVEIRSGG
jgi:hypothetical protein